MAPRSRVAADAHTARPWNSGDRFQTRRWWRFSKVFRDSKRSRMPGRAGCREWMARERTAGAAVSGAAGREEECGEPGIP